MKVLVIGGLGFVGSAICHHWCNSPDVSLVVIDNQSKGTRDNIKGIKSTFLPVDITDRKALDNAFTNIKPEIVIHLAAIHFIPECNQDPARCLETNVVGTENILKACRQTDSVRRVIITSSQAVYPIKDSPNKEEDTPFPCDVYGESKLANEYQAMRFQRETDIDVTVVRLANVYGPRETNPHVVPEIMTQLADGQIQLTLGNIDPKRDFIHTTDVARAYTELAINPRIKGFNVVNVGSGQEFSVRDLLAQLSEILGRQIIYVKDSSRFRSTERMHLVADISHIYDLVGWSPKITLELGLRDLCKWYGLC